jgi:uncharacterized protein YggE
MAFDRSPVVGWRKSVSELGRGLAAVLLGAAVLSGLPLAGQEAAARHPGAVSSLTVAGQGEARVAPDETTVRLGVLAQQASAGAAQQAVNRVVAAVLEAVRRLGVRAEQIQTSELSLSPVFAPVRPGTQGNGGESQEPRIAGYQASNTVTITLEKLDQVGAVIDAGLGAGANRLEGVGFGLRHDEAARQAALREAVAQARAKATTLAAAMHVRLAEVLEVQEEGAAVAPPPRFGPMRISAMASAAEVGTPVSSGQVAVSAGVVVRYRITPCPAQGACE